MATTYIFGAGASCDIGYPLAADMGSRLFDYMANSGTPEFRVASEFFREQFGNAMDIESLLTVAQQRIDELEGASEFALRTERSLLAQNLSHLNFGIQQWFRDIRTGPSHSYKQFCQSIVKAGDTVITFNYDDSLDRELRNAGKWDVADGYGFSLGPTSAPSQVRILKLHGSINWLISLFGGRKGFFAAASSMGDTPVLSSDDLEFLGYREFEGSVFSGGAALPCMILPTRDKRFFYKTSFGAEFEPFWDAVWAQARSALRGADRIVMCGYSLLPVDRRACDLILKTPKPDCPIEIVCGNQSSRIADVFRSNGFTKVDEFHGYFSEWLATPTSSRTEEMSRV